MKVHTEWISWLIVLEGLKNDVYDRSQDSHLLNLLIKKRKILNIQIDTSLFLYFSNV